jgi:hypothetical protein
LLGARYLLRNLKFPAFILRCYIATLLNDDELGVVLLLYEVREQLRLNPVEDASVLRLDEDHLVGLGQQSCGPLKEPVHLRRPTLLVTHGQLLKWRALGFERPLAVEGALALV